MATIEHYPNNSNSVRDGMGPAEAQLIRDSGSEKTVDESASRVRFEGKVAEAKPSIGTMIFRQMFPDGIDGLKRHVIENVIIPWVSNAGYSALVSIADAVFPGHTMPSQPNGRRDGYVSYDNYSKKNNRGTIRVNGGGSGLEEAHLMDYGTIWFSTRRDAELVLMDLRSECETRGIVTVAHLRDMCGLDTRPQQTHFGWASLNQADISPYNGGYVLNLPRAVAID